MSKKLYEMPIDELKKRAKHCKIIFYVYVVAAIGVGFVNGYYSLLSLDNLKNSGITDINLYILILVSILVSVIVFLIIFIWFISETNYYKMLEENANMMIYLKSKLGE